MKLRKAMQTQPDSALMRDDRDEEIGMHSYAVTWHIATSPQVTAERLKTAVLAKEHEGWGFIGIENLPDRVVVRSFYRTPKCGYIDKQELTLTEEAGGGSKVYGLLHFSESLIDQIRGFSTSTNFCPGGCPNFVRACCSWWKCFGDGGLNRRHLRVCVQTYIVF